MNYQPHRDELFPYFEQLFPDYRDYCLTVSRRMYALSIETCAYVWWLCDQLEARSVVDMGSGFSSYVLRRYAANAPYPVEFASVDDDPGWMAKTVAYLDRQAIPSTNLHTPEEWAALDGRYDMIVYDFSGGPARNEWMQPAVEHVTPKGVVVFDDAQNPLHHIHMCEVAQGRLTLLDLYYQTLDQVGRWATIGVPA